MEPKSFNKLTDEEKDRQVEIEIKTAKQIAQKLFAVVSNKEFVKEVPDPLMRHQVVTMQLEKMDKASGTQMYTSFGSAYPIVIKYMTQQVAYNSKAFEKFLRAMMTNPGKGMEGFIEHQANYVKLLYIESSKASGRRVNMKEANKRKNAEYELMNKVRKEMEANKKKAENEFEEESKKHLDEKRKELLEFINKELEDYQFSDEEKSADDSSESAEPDKMSDEAYFESMTREEQLAKIETLRFLEKTDVQELNRIDQEIRRIQKQLKKATAQVKQSFLPQSLRKTRKPKRSRR